VSVVKRALPWIWTAIVVAITAALFFTGSFDRSGFGSRLAAALWASLPVLMTVCGALILSRRHQNRIGWILMVAGLGVVLDGVAQPYVTVAPTSPTALDYVMLFVANFSWVIIFFPLFLLLHLFPDGRYVSRRWSWAGWLAGTMIVVLLVFGSLQPTISDPNGTWSLPNPLGVFSTNVFDTVLSGPWFVGLMVLALGGLVAMMVRFRRSTPVVRTQIKWVLYAATLLALMYAFTLVTNEMGKDSFGGFAVGVLFVLSLALIPISITAAILRYKLFEIDRIISRTLSYAVVVGVLAAVYFGGVAAVTSLLPTQNAVAVAGATLLVAAMFNPLRKRVQHMVDHRFNRSAYQAEVVAADFATHLRESLTIEELADLWNHTVTEFLQPATSSLWVNQGREEHR
jgi:hypothetical protein